MGLCSSCLTSTQRQFLLKDWTCFKMIMHPPHTMFLVLCTENWCWHNWVTYTFLLQNTVSVVINSKISHTHPPSLPPLARAQVGRQLAVVFLMGFWLPSKIWSPHRTSETNASERLNLTGTIGNTRKRSPQRRGSCWWVWWQCLPETLMQRNDHKP